MLDLHMRKFALYYFLLIKSNLSRRHISLNLRSNLCDFLGRYIEAQNKGTAAVTPSTMFQMFMSFGCDYFELLQFFSHLKKYTVDDLETFISFAPEAQPLEGLDLNTIHAMIPRWTATKYHAAPIHEVLKDIRMKILTCQGGVYVYNSNLNPRNTRSPNDPYMLLISGRQSVFLDINRRRSFRYDFNSNCNYG